MDCGERAGVCAKLGMELRGATIVRAILLAIAAGQMASLDVNRQLAVSAATLLILSEGNRLRVALTGNQYSGRNTGLAVVNGLVHLPLTLPTLTGDTATLTGDITGV